MARACKACDSVNRRPDGLKRLCARCEAIRVKVLRHSMWSPERKRELDREGARLYQGLSLLEREEDGEADAVVTGRDVRRNDVM